MTQATIDDFPDDEYDDEPGARPMSEARRRRRQERKKRQAEQRASVRRSEREVVAELSGGGAREAAFAPTYNVSRYEAGWLFSSLGSFYGDQLITDILYHVKGGKEASVYCCRAHPSTGVELLAAKVYRPRELRSMRNDALYREGRGLLTAQGRAVLSERGRQAQKPDRRTMRAVAGKSAFGQQVLHASWLSYEFSFMERLYRAGGAVPQPFACGENAVLMGFVGDEQMAAPTLSSVRLAPDEAALLLGDALRNIDLMLAHGFIHGDLSAYNILYWEGQLVLIDFPQVTDINGNPSAFAILQRDVARVCEYFARCGAPSDPAAIADELWARHAAVP